MGKSALLKVCAVLMITGACSSHDASHNPVTRFEFLPASRTKIDFENRLEYTERLNTYTYKNFYNGGGVGLGDFNNDGLVDIFFSGNLVPSRLYINKGNLVFEDITTSSGIGNEITWTTGVSVVDINGDGFLDIYLCKSGPPGGNRRANELFLNNGDLTFHEEADSYNLAFEGLSTHAAFFDFDRDGDLDCYLLNNSFRSVGGYDLRIGQRDIPDPKGGNKLLRNDDGKFVDVTGKAGIYSSQIGFGLGVSIGDLNRDGWTDIYVSNDFFEKDYLYLNDQDGTFHECLEDYVQEISMGSMGADIADINNDGFPEIFVTEMLPEHDDRLKTTAQFESWDKYNLNIKSGYYRQFSRNVLQLNNGNGTFSEIGRFAGVAATDWSWGALIFDMDNDGFKDIFVANGIYKDLLNQDYVNFSSSPELLKQISERKKAVILQLIDSIPSTPLSNYAFQNKGDLTFANRAKEWGLDTPGFSNGSAYADLDNDGDMDIVLNNVNSPASIYENRSNLIDSANRFVGLVLHGEGSNTFAFGAKVTVRSGDKLFYQELSPMRGFMSSVDNRIYTGLGNVDSIDSIIVDWPDQRRTVIEKVKADTILHLSQKDATAAKTVSDSDLPSSVFKEVVIAGLDFTHIENDYSDFDRDRLLFTMASNEGPCLCTGDANGDGLDDFYVGGAKDQAGALFLQNRHGGFVRSSEKPFIENKVSEDTGCVFFDANGDGRQDLYVTSGGSEFSRSSVALLDRLYISSGNGKFVKSDQPLPVSTNFESTAAVRSADYDGDGDQDLFVGARLIPGSYGLPANGYLLKNDGHGKFENVTATVAPSLLNTGLITSARWVDVNNDSRPDLVVVGEWMKIRLFMNENGKLEERTEQYGLSKTEGWYHAVGVADLNNDGFMDFITGNYGLNTRFKASVRQPVLMYVNDFDKNGTLEQITTTYDNGVQYPMLLRQDLISQIPSLKKKFLHFRDYKNKTMADIFSPVQLHDAIVLNAYTFESAVWINSGKGTFEKHVLPREAQLFPVSALLVDDFTGDGHLDILLGGNQFRAKPETGIYAAGYGLLLAGDSSGNFKAVRGDRSGLSVRGEIRAFGKIQRHGKQFVLVAKNNDKVAVLGY